MIFLTAIIGTTFNLLMFVTTTIGSSGKCVQQRLPFCQSISFKSKMSSIIQLNYLSAATVCAVLTLSEPSYYLLACVFYLYELITNVFLLWKVQTLPKTITSFRRRFQIVHTTSIISFAIINILFLGWFVIQQEHDDGFFDSCYAYQIIYSLIYQVVSSLLFLIPINSIETPVGITEIQLKRKRKRKQFFQEHIGFLLLSVVLGSVSTRLRFINVYQSMFFYLCYVLSQTVSLGILTRHAWKSTVFRICAPNVVVLGDGDRVPKVNDNHQFEIKDEEKEPTKKPSLFSRYAGGVPTNSTEYSQLVIHDHGLLTFMAKVVYEETIGNVRKRSQSADFPISNRTSCVKMKTKLEKSTSHQPSKFQTSHV